MKKVSIFFGCLFLFQVSNNALAQTIFTENFSTATGTTPPTGWVNNEILAGGGQWFFDNPAQRIANLPIAAPFAIFDSDFLEVYGEEAAVQSPAFDAAAFTGGYFFLTFDHYYPEQYDSEYFVEVYDGTDWVTVLNGSSETTNAASELIDITSVVSGVSNAQVRFRYVGEYSWYWIVDNVKVAHYDCLPVTDLTLGNETTTSLEIDWTAGDTETSWNIQWGALGFIPGTGTELGSDVATTNNYTVNGLNHSTNYDVYVQADCGGSGSVWVKVSGMTLCDVISTFPWTENFDQMTELGDELYPTCWNASTLEWFSDYTNSGESGATALSGTNFMATYSYGQDTLWTPEFQLNAGDKFEFKFNFAGDPYQESGWSGEVVLYDVQSGTSTALPGGEFVTSSDVLTPEYRAHATCFNPTTSGVYRFGISITSTWDPSYLVLDDFSLIKRGNSAGTDGTMNVCQTAGLVNLNAIITKDDQFGSWEFVGNPTVIQNDTMFNPEFVSAGVVYVNYITRDCLKDTASAIVTIFPPSSAGVDGNLTVCKNEPVNLIAGLTGVVNLGGSWINPQSQTITNSQIMAPNFAGQYNYKYIAGNNVCPNDTALVVLTVGSCDWLSVDELALEEMNLFPNPSNGVVYIESNSSIGTFNLVVLDINGRTVETATNSIVSGMNTVNLGQVEKGTYFFKLSNEHAEKTFRVVIQ